MPLDLEALVAPSHSALVLQEVQHGVVGEPSVLPELAAAAARTRLVEHCDELARAARAVEVRVVHCTAATRPDGFGANHNARLFAGVAKAAVSLAPGSEAVRPAIEVDERDFVLERHQGLGPMAGTELDAILRNEGVRTIVGAGVSVNIGMLDLAFDAVNAGYQVVIVRDAVAGVPDDDAAAVLRSTLSLVATLVETSEVVSAWRDERAGITSSGGADGENTPI